MSEAYRNAIANHGASLITYIGLVDDMGVELSGGNPAYARKAVAWEFASGGTIRPTADLVFDVPPGKIVGGWRSYSAVAAGTDYGGRALTQESFTGQGQYKLLKDNTGIKHENTV